MPWETLLVSCTHLVEFLFYPHFSTVNCVFEGPFLPHHLRLCPASLPLSSRQENRNFAKVLACCHLLQIRIDLTVSRGLYSKVLQCVRHSGPNKVNLELSFFFLLFFHFQVQIWFSNLGFKHEIHFIFQFQF